MAATGTVAVVGLGNMGGGMARTLRRAGVATLGVDPAPGAAERFDGGLEVVALAEAVRRAGTLVLSLPGSAVVEQVLGEAGLLGPGVEHRLVVDTSTSDPLVTRRLAAATAVAGHSLVDAPVSGGPAGAESGTLNVFLGGEDDAVAEAAPVLDLLAGRVTHVGGPGAGNVAKLVNNMLCAVHLQAAGEALTLGRAAGLDPARLFEAVNGATGRSAVTEVNLPKWVLSGSFDSGFPVGLMARDVELAVSTATGLGVDLPLAAGSAAAWRELRDEDAAADFNRMANRDRIADREQEAGTPQ
jgi:3-hydroxyisobutyrate dehydrogenase